MYLYNIETQKVIEGETFPSSCFQFPWREATQEEINAYLLRQAKNAKRIELSEAFSAFQEARFEYGSHTFCFCMDALSNISLASHCTPGSPGLYKFFGRRLSDNVREEVNFVDQAGWDAFSGAIHDEWDRCMKYSETKKAAICAAETVGEVEDITINFSA